MREWFTTALDVDEDALAERYDGTLLFDRAAIRLLTRDNQMSLWRSTPDRRDRSDGTTVLDVTLRCVAHAHPDCRFRWASITLDFSATERAQVLDMSPREAVTDRAVAQVATTTPDFRSYNIRSQPLSPEAARLRADDLSVCFPTITTSGPRFSYAMWTFAAHQSAPLHVDRELRLLVTMPIDSVRVPIMATLRGEVEVKGRKGLLPLVGRRARSFWTHDDLG